MNDSVLSVASMECVTVVLLYNLALALHREAFQSSHDPAPAALDRVLYMYRQAHTILEKINLVDSPEVVSVLAALYFNMQQIYGMRFQVDVCCYLRERLATIFTWGGSAVIGKTDYMFYHFHMHVALPSRPCRLSFCLHRIGSFHTATPINIHNTFI